MIKASPSSSPSSVPKKYDRTQSLLCASHKRSHHLISYDQTAYVKGRYTGESVRLIDDLLKYVDENIDGILFAADIEKTFDLVDHNIMFAALKRFGFENVLVRWIKTIFKKSQSCVMNNGTCTGYFNLEKGARQGDSLSPYLFILALETLFIQITSDSSFGLSISK